MNSGEWTEATLSHVARNGSQNVAGSVDEGRSGEETGW